MAKKASKRRSRARAVRQPSVAAAVQPAAPAPATRPANSPGESTSISHADLAEEYRYVYSDLKRVGILAGSMLGLLIVLALLAQYLF